MNHRENWEGNREEKSHKEYWRPQKGGDLKTKNQQMGPSLLIFFVRWTIRIACWNWIDEDSC